MLPPLTPWVKRLLGLLLGAYVAQIFLENWLDVPVFGLLALEHGRPGLDWGWQWISHVFVAPTTSGQLIFQLISWVFLWWILAPFEARFGFRHLWRLALVALVAESVAAIAVSTSLRLMDPPLFGAGAILLAGISAFTRTLPQHGKLSLFGAVSLTPKQLLGVLIGFSVLFFLVSKNLTSLVADLAALAAGYYFFWFSAWFDSVSRGRRRRTASGKTSRSKGRSKRFDVISGGRGGFGSSDTSSRGDGDDERPKWLN